MSRIATVGGGPAGLYFAILAKRAEPDREVVVFERSPADDTSGWGVVFSDETLSSLEQNDPEVYGELAGEVVRWDAIEVCRRGEIVRSRGHGFAGIARRKLLSALRRRAESLGVDVRYGAEVTEVEQLAREYDLLVGADGVKSRVRTTFAKEFRPAIESRGGRYIWLGTRRRFDSLTFIFEQNAKGTFWAHAYRYDAQSSTFIVECDEDSFRTAGLDVATAEQSVAYCEQLFARHLCGHSLTTGGSSWTRFATVRNDTWHCEGVVLLGDAAHTAHFSIGSGTKMALEDAAALARACSCSCSLGGRAALEAYETKRRPVVERIQKAADGSLAWFENVRRYWNHPPLSFAFGLLTRSEKVGYGNLDKRDPEFVARVNDAFAQESGAGPGTLPLFVPFSLRSLKLDNRLVADPQSAQPCSAGLVVTEVGRPGDLSWYKRTVDSLRERSRAKLCLRLGRVKENPTRRACRAFALAARMAERSGFDMLELYLAHLYWPPGLALEVFEALRAVWPEDKPISVCLPATDGLAGGPTVYDIATTARILKARGCDLIAVTVDESNGALQPRLGTESHQVSCSDFIRNEVGIPTAVMGPISSVDQVNTILASRRADLCVLVNQFTPDAERGRSSRT